eukprot:Platyproteum_vivax@DN8220_c0_g1_i1.p1
MKILDGAVAPMTNAEAYGLCKKQLEGLQDGAHKKRHMYQTIMEYLEGIDCHRPPTHIQNLLRDLRKFDLTQAEILQILNHQACEEVDLHVLLCRLPDRLTDQQVENLLQVLRSHFQSALTPDSK